MSKLTYKKYMTESFLYEADDEDRYVHVGGGVYKEKDGKGQPLPNSPKYLKKDNGGFEMVDDEDPRLKKGDDKEKKKPVNIDIDASGGFDKDADKAADEPHYSPKIDGIQDVDDIPGTIADDPDLFNAIEDEETDVDDGFGKKLSIDDLNFKVSMINAGEDPEDHLDPFDDEDDLVDAWKRNVNTAIQKQGRTGTEKTEIKVINGKKYKPIKEDRNASILQHQERELEKALKNGNEDEIYTLRNAIAYTKSKMKKESVKESVNKRVTVREVKSWLKGLEEFRYRKIPGVDVRRITSFVNNGLSETDLPKSLQKKWESAKYSKEKGLADRFMKERINKKLTQNESKHPIKERYDRLFKNKVVL